MKKYKKVKLLIVCSFVVFTSINHAMNNSVRRVGVPALQSGLRSYSASAVDLARASRTSVPVYSKPKIHSISAISLQEDTNKLVQSLQKDDTASKKLHIINPLDSQDYRSDVIKTISNRAAEQVEGAANVYEGTIDPVKYPELVKFVKKYHCSFGDEMVARLTLDHQATHGKTKIERGLNRFQAGPTMFVKGARVDRIINAERMKEVIKRYDLDSLRVAEKYTLDIDNSVCIVAKKIHFKDFGKISLQEAQQLFKFMLATGYCDWQFNTNILRDDEGKLTFIDTENNSFTIGEKWGKMKFILNNYVGNTLFNEIEYFDKDAQAWFDETLKINKYDTLGSWNFWKQQMWYMFADRDDVIPLKYNSEYDAAIGIDFEKVKEETTLLQKQLLMEGKIKSYKWF